MFLYAFPIVVCVSVSASVVSVLNIYRCNVCTISIETKGQHPKRANIEISENSFVRVGWGTLPPPRKVCYLLVACWVQVLRFICLLGTGVLLGHTERPMASSGSLQGIKRYLFQE